MRLICTIKEKQGENPYEFSYYLTAQGIENECEQIENAGKREFRIWVIDEDKVDSAQQIYQEYKENPKSSIYRSHNPAAMESQADKLNQLSGSDSKQENPRRSLLSPAPYGPISSLILFTVLTLFIWSHIQRENFIPPKIRGIIQAPLFSPLERHLIYDFPQYFELRDALFKIYTPQQIEQKQSPTAEALRLIAKIQSTPVWMGFYDRFLNYYRNVSPLSYHGPLFEKIGSGEIWRIFTPILLHVDLLHIFFNILWFILLGNQIEFRIGTVRYIILILLTAIFSNTAQYLMSGPFFMGLSGVVVGMAAFIWARQQLAPWEGYLLNRMTLFFLAIFVIGMFLLQIVFFFLQLSGKLQLTIGIANTAHLTGGIVGYLLGRLRPFSMHLKSQK